MKSVCIFCIAGALGVVGCQKKEEPSQALIEPSAPANVAAAAVASSPSMSSAIPIEEDFEQKAEATISANNVNRELEKLKQEIGR